MIVEDSKQAGRKHVFSKLLKMSAKVRTESAGAVSVRCMNSSVVKDVWVLQLKTKLELKTR